LEIDREQARAHGVGRDILGIPILSRGIPIGSFTAWVAPSSGLSLSASFIECLTRLMPLLTSLAALQSVTGDSDEYSRFLENMRAIVERCHASDSPKLPDNTFVALCARLFEPDGPRRLRVFISEDPGSHFELTGEFPTYDREPARRIVLDGADSILTFARNRALRLSGAMLMHRAVFFGGNPDVSKQGPYTIILESGKEPIRADVWVQNAINYGRHPNCGFYVCPIVAPDKSASFDVRSWTSKVCGVLVVDNCDIACPQSGMSPSTLGDLYQSSNAPPRNSCTCQKAVLDTS
jgi:hypothetical protein